MKDWVSSAHSQKQDKLCQLLPLLLKIVLKVLASAKGKKKMEKIYRLEKERENYPVH